jgi:hypothetical protein
MLAWESPPQTHGGEKIRTTLAAALQVIGVSQINVLLLWKYLRYCKKPKGMFFRIGPSFVDVRRRLGYEKHHQLGLVLQQVTKKTPFNNARRHYLSP